MHDQPATARVGSIQANAVRASEVAHGAGMDSAELSEAFATALGDSHDRAVEPGDAGTADREGAAQRIALVRGRELVTRIGNKSNLILDPDLDSYYTMSLVLLRLPELLETTRDVTARMRTFVASGRPMSGGTQTQFFILEGRLDAVSKSIQSDFVEAFSASPDRLLDDALDAERARLLSSVEAFRSAARKMLEPASGPEQLAGLMATHVDLLRVPDSVWAQSSGQLNRMIDERIEGFFHRVWLHPGTALVLLCLILAAVTTVARHIAIPLQRLPKVAESVRRQGDRGLRAAWNSSDEIGRLVTGFNGMLDQLAAVRGSERELAATAGAAVALRELVESLPTPVMVAAIPTHEVLHANGPAQAWLTGGGADPWVTGLDPTTRAYFFQRLADEEVVDQFEVNWKGGASPVWALLAAASSCSSTGWGCGRRSRGIVREHHDRGGRPAHPERRSRVLPQHGHDMRDVIGESPDFLLGATDPDAVGIQSFDRYWPLVEARGGWQGEVCIRRRDLTTYPAWIVISAVREGAGGLTHYICTSLDISERKASQERISFLAERCADRAAEPHAVRPAPARGGRGSRGRRRADRGAVHRPRSLQDDQRLARSPRRGRLAAIGVAAPARRGPDGDTVSRLGGDEFVVVLRGVRGREEVLASVDDRLVASIRAPHMVRGTELQLSCSVGIAIYPDDATDIDELMRRADVAMYQAKTLGRDSAQLFTADLDDRAERKLTLQSSRGTRWNGANCPCITSRRSMRRPGRWSAWRRCSAGTRPNSARSRRSTSPRSPRNPR